MAETTPSSSSSSWESKCKEKTYCAEEHNAKEIFIAAYDLVFHCTGSTLCQKKKEEKIRQCGFERMAISTSL